MTRAKAFTAGTDRKYKYDSLSNLVYESDITGGALTGDDTPGTVAGGTVNTTDYRYNNLNQLTNLTVDENQNYVYTYDKNGNETSETLSGADVTGGSTGTVQLAMTYDVANKMVKGVNAAGEQSLYTYNALGVLVNNTKVSGTPSQTVFADYVLDYTTDTKVPLVETEQGGNVYKNTYGMNILFDPVNSSILNPVIGTVSVPTKVSVKSTNATSAALISKLNLEQDRLGSTKFATADDGSAAAYLDYNEWGIIGNGSANLAGLQPAVYNNLKSYTGHEYDGVLALYYAKARMYDPNIKRFTQLDPAKDGDNLYAYCENDPLKITDPLGLFVRALDQASRLNILIQYSQYMSTDDISLLNREGIVHFDESKIPTSSSFRMSDIYRESIIEYINYGYSNSQKVVFDDKMYQSDRSSRLYFLKHYARVQALKYIDQTAGYFPPFSTCEPITDADAYRNIAAYSVMLNKAVIDNPWYNWQVLDDMLLTIGPSKYSLSKGTYPEDFYSVASNGFSKGDSIYQLKLRTFGQTGFSPDLQEHFPDGRL